MRWHKAASSLSLSPGDLTVMTQCDMPVSEVLNRQHPNPNIPPLWSVLSYTMLRTRGEPVDIWKNYRFLQGMAKHRDAWYYRHWIPKASGGLRMISVPAPTLRSQQEFILEAILKELPVDGRACAYRKGVSITRCAAPHVGQELLIHLDIRDFFGSITENRVYEVLLEETGYSRSLCRFLARMCCHRCRLPQGAVTSPALSNIVFRSCDEELACLAEKWGMEYTRYSDDLFFSGNGTLMADVFVQEAGTVLRSHGFRLNAEKTKILRRQHRQTVLGLTVNERLQVNRQYRRNLMQELHYLERFEEKCTGALREGDYLRYMQKLLGKVDYVLQIDPDNVRLREERRKLKQRIRRRELRLNKRCSWIRDFPF